MKLSTVWRDCGIQRPGGSPRSIHSSLKSRVRAASTGHVGEVDPDLAVVVEAWPDLPESFREAVLRIVAEARQGGEVGSL